MKFTAAAIFTASFVVLSAGVPIERHALPPIESTVGVGPVIPSIDVARPVLNHVPRAGRRQAHEASNSLRPVISAGDTNPGAHAPNDAFSAFNSPGPVMPADMPELVMEKQGERHRLAHEREELEKRYPGGGPGAVDSVVRFFRRRFCEFPWKREVQAAPTILGERKAAQPRRVKRSLSSSGVPDVAHKFVSAEGATHEHEADLGEGLFSGHVKSMLDQPRGKEIELDEGTSEERERQREKAAKDRLIDWAGGPY